MGAPMNLCDIREIKALLARHGFRFSKAMGQNFLTAAWVPEQIAEKAGLTRADGVLEIGPGIGCLTERLSRAAGKVVAVELDRALFPILAETLRACDNVEVVPGDIMKTDIHALLDEKLADMPVSVCANLPYQITTPVLARLIDTGRFQAITVMLQREVARRICASAGTSDYGAFSLYAQYHMVPVMLFDVPPECFIPQPKVTSTVLRMTKRAVPPVSLQNEAVFWKTIKAAFAMRRKTLQNALTPAFGQAIPREALALLISACGFDPRIRGEALDLQGFADIANAIATRLSS